MSSGAWLHPETTGAALPPPRFFHCGAAVGSQAFIFGGRAPIRTPKADLLNDLWCLNTVRALHVLCEGSGYQRSAEWCVHCPMKDVKELAMEYEQEPSGTTGQGLYYQNCMQGCCMSVPCSTLPLLRDRKAGSCTALTAMTWTTAAARVQAAMQAASACVAPALSPFGMYCSTPGTPCRLTQPPWHATHLNIFCACSAFRVKGLEFRVNFGQASAPQATTPARLMTLPCSAE